MLREHHDEVHGETCFKPMLLVQTERVFLLVTSYCVLKGLCCNSPLQSTGDKAFLESGLAMELEGRMCHADHSSICRGGLGLPLEGTRCDMSHLLRKIQGDFHFFI